MDGLLQTTFDTFFPEKYGNNIMSETSCEPNMLCDRNQDCFKSFLASWLTTMTQIAPYTYEKVIPKIVASAEGAAKQCSGGESGSACGRRWYQSTWDGSTSMESDMSALSIFSSAMTIHKKNVRGPLTSDTGGTSESDPDAGTDTKDSHKKLPDVTTADRAGAGILTVIFVCGWAGGLAWLVLGG